MLKDERECSNTKLGREYQRIFYLMLTGYMTQIDSYMIWIEQAARPLILTKRFRSRSQACTVKFMHIYM